MREILVKRLNTAILEVDFYKKELTIAEVKKEVLEDLLKELDEAETEKVLEEVKEEEQGINL